MALGGTLTGATTILQNGNNFSLSNGNVGIGTQLPGATLETSGDFRVSNGTVANTLGTPATADASNTSFPFAGQSFTLPAGGGSITSVRLRSRATYSTTFAIYQGAGNGGTLLYGPAPISFTSDVPSTVPLATPLALPAGVYTVTLTAPQSLRYFSTDVYAGGSFYFGGTAGTNIDMEFAINYSTGTPVSNLYVAPNGNVGIGTTGAPGQRLDVSGGSIRIGTTGQGLIFPDGTVQTTAAVPASGYILNQTTPQAGASFNVAGSGTVGTGLNVDAANAQADTWNGGATALRFGGSGTGEGLASARSGANAFGLDLYTAGTKRLSLRNNGYLGLGVAVPDSKFVSVTEGSTNGPEDDYLFRSYGPAPGLGISLQSAHGSPAAPTNLVADDYLGTIGFSPQYNGGFGTFVAAGMASYYRGDGTTNASDLRLQTSGLDRVFIGPTGRVGLGTILPEAKLAGVTNNSTGGAEDDYLFESFGSNPSIGIALRSSHGSEAAPANLNNGDYLGVIGFGGRANGGYTAYTSAGLASYYRGNGTTDLTELRLQTSTADRVTITETGRVGIGTTTPGNTLDVNGTIWAANSIRVDAGGTNNGALGSSPALFFGSAANSTVGLASKRTAGGNQNGLDLYTNNTNRLAISSGGQVSVSNLAGTGSRVVVANASGTLSTSTAATSALESLLQMQKGTVTVGPGGANATVQVTITFATPFATVPVVTVTPRNESGTSYDDTFAATIRSVSTTQCVVNVRRVDTTGLWGQQLQLSWVAIP